MINSRSKTQVESFQTEMIMMIWSIVCQLSWLGQHRIPLKTNIIINNISNQIAHHQWQALVRWIFLRFWLSSQNSGWCVGMRSNTNTALTFILSWSFTTAEVANIIFIWQNVSRTDYCCSATVFPFVATWVDWRL